MQVLLWTVLPLTIFLFAFSLTGIGSHQRSMRSLAGEEAQRLAGAVATGVAQQLDSYQVGLEAAALLLAHHAGDPATRASTLVDTSAVMGHVELVLFDATGHALVSSTEVMPAWATESPPANSAAAALDRWGEHVLVRAELPDDQGILVAAVPLQVLAFASYLGASADLYGTSLEMLDDKGAPMLSTAAAGHEGAIMHTASADDSLVTGSAPVPGTGWTVRMVESWHTRTAPLIRMEQAMPFVLAVAAAVSFLTLYFGLRLVVQPLRSLATRAQRIGSGDFAAASDPVGGVEEIENVRAALDQMADQIRSHQRALEQHVFAVTRAQEDERARLARELHDETVQGLIALDHRLQKAQRTLQRQPESLRDEIAALRQMARTAMEEVRRFSRALRPAYLEDLGLCPALELLSEEAGVIITIAGEQRRLDPTVELSLFRVAQESINNARRHARAQRIELHLAFSPTTITLRVRDDGAGFVPPAQLDSLSRDGHFGLLGIQERADLIGARLTVESIPGTGTTVTMSLAG